MYLDLILDAKQPYVALPDAIDVAEYEVGICHLAVPKTFNNTITHISVQSGVIDQQYKGQRTLYTLTVHDAHRGPSLLVEPVHIQYRQFSVQHLKDISLTLLDQDGKLVEFDGGKILLVLHLRSKLTWKEDF